MNNNKRSLGTDQGGIIFTLPVIVASILGILGISLISTIDWTFLVPLFAMGTMFVAVVGFSFGKIKKFNHVLYIAVGMTAVMVFIEIGAMTAAGVAVIGASIYYFGPGSAKQPAFFIGLIGAGMLLMIWGATYVLAPMGVVP